MKNNEYSEIAGNEYQSIFELPKLDNMNKTQAINVFDQCKTLNLLI